MDPELEKKLDEINQNLIAIKGNTKGHIAKSFFTGSLSGLGSIVGVAIALTIAGYVLNAIGVIPALKEQATFWRSTIENLQKSR